ncbi:MAG: type VII toxin-antitoxin system HepT family RNase toxin [Caldisericia bacterium]
MNIDYERIKKRVSEIEEAINEINKLISINEIEFWRDNRNISAIKYYLLIAIEAVGAICVHIIAKSLGKSSSSFGECFDILKENKIISDELSLRLKRMVKFRNKLIHKYWDIDDKLVYEYVKFDIKDFYEFIKEIKKLLILL